VKLASFNLVGDEGSAHLDWLKELELSAQDKLAVAEEAMRSQAINAHADVPPGEYVSGWFAGAVSPERPSGGTPGLTFIVHDVIGNQYKTRIEAQSPRVYTSEKQPHKA
jgi:hypothetical protein